MSKKKYQDIEDKKLIKKEFLKLLELAQWISAY